MTSYKAVALSLSAFVHSTNALMVPSRFVRMYRLAPIRALSVDLTSLRALNNLFVSSCQTAKRKPKPRLRCRDYFKSDAFGLHGKYWGHHRSIHYSVLQCGESCSIFA